MAAPRYVPSKRFSEAHELARESVFYSSPDFVPDRWLANRPGETSNYNTDTQEDPDTLEHAHTPPKRLNMDERFDFGFQGPDQGYMLKLAKRFVNRLILMPGEDVHDVLAGCSAVALKRASLFGRAPVVYDLILVLQLFGFLRSDTSSVETSSLETSSSSEDDGTNVSHVSLSAPVDNDSNDNGLTAWRFSLFSGASGHHSYETKQHILSVVPDKVLRNTPAYVAANMDSCRSLLRRQHTDTERTH